MFNLNEFEVIDISHTVIPGEDANRPFAIQKALLQDKTFRYDILKTHTHVGCHVEVGAHFYDNGKTITEYPLDRFHGPGVLLSVKEMVVTDDICEKSLANKIQEGDIVVIRNDTGIKLTKQQLYLEGEDKLPKLTPSAAKWLAKYKPKLIVLDYIRFGEDIEETRIFHDILMSLDVNFVEFVDNLEKITQERFYVMALPYKVNGLDSSFCRAIVIQEKR
ncbi:MAG: cyclase family protein [Promethearchaeota archaeon]|jgi:kynurenine formamidase